MNWNTNINEAPTDMLLACIKHYKVGLCQVCKLPSNKRCYIVETIPDVVAWGFIKDFEKPLDCPFRAEDGFDTIECRGCAYCLGVTNDGRIKCLKEK